MGWFSNINFIEGLYWISTPTQVNGHFHLGDRTPHDSRDPRWDAWKKT